MCHCMLVEVNTWLLIAKVSYLANGRWAARACEQAGSGALARCTTGALCAFRLPAATRSHRASTQLTLTRLPSCSGTSRQSCWR